MKENFFWSSDRGTVILTKVGKTKKTTFILLSYNRDHQDTTLEKEASNAGNAVSSEVSKKLRKWSDIKLD